MDGAPSLELGVGSVVGGMVGGRIVGSVLVARGKGEVKLGGARVGVVDAPNTTPNTSHGDRRGGRLER